ncbi:phasin family protein [Allosphingosinicella sp.]|uniref:phasin family protein n=1 Tax=Allosphingosinicella sp. TaxID=2823234 RepID=UPI002F25AC9F
MADQQNQTPTAAAAVDATAKASAAIAKAATPAVTEKAEAPAAAAKAAAAPAKAAAKVIKAATAASAKPARKTRAAKPTRKAGRPAKRAAAATATTNTATRTTRIQNEGTRIMKKETAQVADRLQAVFGDVNERARTQIERNTRIAEEMTELSKGNVEAFVASTKVVAKGLETVGQEVAEYSRKSFEDASAALKSFTEVKSATDFFRLQSDFARSQFDGLVAESSKLSETMIKLAGDVAEPLASRYSVAAERVKAAAAL